MMRTKMAKFFQQKNILKRSRLKLKLNLHWKSLRKKIIHCELWK